MKRISTRLALPTAALIGVVVVASCGGDDTNGTDMGSMGDSNASTPSGDEAMSRAHNDADVTFAAGMILHHGQAIEMAEMAASQASDPQVQQLASQIEAAQNPEIEQMSAWLSAWGEDVPDPSMGDMPGMDTGDMRGMMSSGEMDELSAAQGSDFDRMFLQVMIQHHEGAIDMARDELDQGQNSNALQLAQAIIDGQTAEIETMRHLLKILDA
jgi:uncharacterized protein (DUF305 family)